MGTEPHVSVFFCTCLNGSANAGYYIDSTTKAVTVCVAMNNCATSTDNAACLKDANGVAKLKPCATAAANFYIKDKVATGALSAGGLRCWRKHSRVSQRRGGT